MGEIVLGFRAGVVESRRALLFAREDAIERDDADQRLLIQLAQGKR